MCVCVCVYFARAGSLEAEHGASQHERAQADERAHGEDGHRVAELPRGHGEADGHVGRVPRLVGVLGVPLGGQHRVVGVMAPVDGGDHPR